MDAILLVFGLSAAVERIVEYFIGWIFDLEKLKPYSKAQRYIAGGFGIFIAWKVNLDLIVMMGGPEAGAIGWVLMGLAIGGGSEFVHLILEGFSGSTNEG